MPTRSPPTLIDTLILAASTPKDTRMTTTPLQRPPLHPMSTSGTTSRSVQAVVSARACMWPSVPYSWARVVFCGHSTSIPYLAKYQIRRYLPKAFLLRLRSMKVTSDREKGGQLKSEVSGRKRKVFWTVKGNGWFCLMN